MLHTKYWKLILIGSAWQSHTWLDCDTELSSRKNIVTKLQCRVCAKFKTRIATRRNVNERWFRGAESVHTSNICNHAQADQDIDAMPVTAYIAAVGASCILMILWNAYIAGLYVTPACAINTLSKQFGKVADQIIWYWSDKWRTKY